MKLIYNDIKRMVEEQLKLIKGLKDVKKFYFTSRDISQLGKLD